MNPLLWFAILPAAAGIIALIVHVNDKYRARLRTMDRAAIRFALSNFDALTQKELDLITVASLEAVAAKTSDSEKLACIEHLMYDAGRFGHVIDSKEDKFYMASEFGLAVVPMVENTWGISREDLLKAQAQLQ